MGRPATPAYDDGHAASARAPAADRATAQRPMQRAIAAVPRLRQRVVDAPFDLARPRWEDDPTFDLDFHVRRYAVSHDDGAPQHATLQDLFATLGPIYERPFDRTRPLWELIEFDGPGEGAALFFRLHHGVADGVGGNAILAAMTDSSEEESPEENASVASTMHDREGPGAWDEKSFGRRLIEALGHRIEEGGGRAQAAASGALRFATRPSSWLESGRVVGGRVSESDGERRLAARSASAARATWPAFTCHSNRCARPRSNWVGR